MYQPSHQGLPIASQNMACSERNVKFISLLQSSAGCVCNSGKYLLGYDRQTVYGKSWYEMIHPDDIEEARFKHVDCKSHQLCSNCFQTESFVKIYVTAV